MTGGNDKIVLTGAAGLVGQNLAVLLEERGYRHLVGIDKHTHNVGVLRELHPSMEIIEADLAHVGGWSDSFHGARALIMLQAQIGGERQEEFVANNITSTENVLAACRQHGIEFIVHISSSVVNSRARDLYTETKKAQEKLVVESGIKHCILRPTLMFGWFDRKHLGWLSRFMQKVPLFPIPGSGHYPRQPLYILDFCRVIAACLEQEPNCRTYDISGLEEIDYIEIIREIKRATKSRTPIVKIPYYMFWGILKLYAIFDRNPPFTTKQLEALVIPERFPIMPWGEVFGFEPTPFHDAVRETFADPRFANVALEF